MPAERVRLRRPSWPCRSSQAPSADSHSASASTGLGGIVGGPADPRLRRSGARACGGRRRRATCGTGSWRCGAATFDGLPVREAPRGHGPRSAARCAGSRPLVDAALSSSRTPRRVCHSSTRCSAPSAPTGDAAWVHPPRALGEITSRNGASIARLHLRRRAAEPGARARDGDAARIGDAAAGPKIEPTIAARPLTLIYGRARGRRAGRGGGDGAAARGEDRAGVAEVAELGDGVGRRDGGRRAGRDDDVGRAERGGEPTGEHDDRRRLDDRPLRAAGRRQRVDDHRQAAEGGEDPVGAERDRLADGDREHESRRPRRHGLARPRGHGVVMPGGSTFGSVVAGAVGWCSRWRPAPASRRRRARRGAGTGSARPSAPPVRSGRTVGPSPPLAARTRRSRP